MPEPLPFGKPARPQEVFDGKDSKPIHGYTLPAAPPLRNDYGLLAAMIH